jgi:hypothetical protein
MAAGPETVVRGHRRTAALVIPAGVGSRAGSGAKATPFGNPPNLAQWTAIATPFREVLCLPFGSLDLNVSSYRPEGSRGGSMANCPN